MESHILKIVLKKLISGALVLGIFLAPLQSLKANFPETVNPQTSDFISAVQKAPTPFTALGISWHQNIPAGASVAVYVRMQNQNQWGQWYLIQPDIDGVNEADAANPEAFLPMNSTDTFQYKVALAGMDAKSMPSVDNMKFTYIHAGTGSLNQEGQAANTIQTPPLYKDNSKTAFAASVNSSFIAAATTFADPNGLKIISRSQWGADESLRVYKSSNPGPQLVKTTSDYVQKFASELKIIKTIDKDPNGNFLTWPEQYPEKISKIIIHHTATTKNLDNPMQAIRDIYYWHAISRGWGDIGYNYVVDPMGNIYEGRAGGDSVIAAHAGNANNGSIGIAVLGNYDVNDVPDAVIKSLTAFVKAKSQEYNIDPVGSSMFRGENMANVLGHRDVMSTTCPGQKLYDKIPQIRLAAKIDTAPKIINKWPDLAANKLYDYSLANTVPFLQFGPDETKTINISLKNNGPTSWGIGTFLVLSADGTTGTFFKSADNIKSNTLDHEIKVGDTAAFQLQMQSNYVPGIINVEFAPIINGSIKVEKYLRLPAQVTPPVYDYEMQNVVLDQPFLKKDVTTNVTVTLKNTGNITWEKSGKNKFVLGADNKRDHVNKLLVKPSNRLANLTEDQVKPGGIGHFTFQIKAPKSEGLYQEYFTPLMEGITWFANKNSSFKVYVYQKDFAANPVDMISSRQVLPGEQKMMWFKIQNLGGTTWNKTGDNKVDFDISNPKNINIVDTHMEENKVDPGQVATIDITMQGPTAEGTYPLNIMPRIGKNNLLIRSFYFGLQIQKQTSSSAGQTPVQPTVQTPVQSAPSLSPQPVTAPTISQISNPNIRIDLSFRGSPTIISANGPFALQNGAEDLATFQANEKVSVTADQNNYYIKGNQVNLTVSTPPRFYSPNSAILRVDNFTRPNSWNPSVNNNEFRGILEVHFYNKELHTINELPLEDYLKGTGEISDQDPIEKIKTILILSRSYALYYIKVAQKFPGAPFNLTDDPQTSQKYMGYDYEKSQPNTVKAATDTAGMVVTYQGKVIKTPYFSSDDGRTRSAEAVWGWKDTPYLTSVADPYCAGKTMNGHGVGLSGCGSLGMAKAGKTYQEIIKYYYQGVDIQKVY